MDLMPIFTILRDKRRLVALSFVVSIAIAVLMVYKVSLLPPHIQSKQYTVGAAVQNVQIDSSRSSAADLNPPGASTAGSGAPNLVNQADLLANLMLSAPIETSIADQLHIPLSDLTVTNSATTGLPVISTELATSVASTLPPTRAYDLTIVANVGLPILTLQSQAPTPHGAAALSSAATAALRNYIQTTAAQESIPENDVTIVRSLGPPQYGLSQRGPKKLYAVVAAFLTMVALCSLIVFVTGRRRARALGSFEHPPMYRRPEHAAHLSDTPPPGQTETDWDSPADAFIDFASPLMPAPDGTDDERSAVQATPVAAAAYNESNGNGNGNGNGKAHTRPAATDADGGFGSTGGLDDEAIDHRTSRRTRRRLPAKGRS